MGRTPVSSAKFIVSSESVGVPTADPWMACSPTMSCNGVTAIGSDDMPTTTNIPVGARPSIKLDIAFESGAVASIACAPPSFCNSSAALLAWLSIAITTLLPNARRVRFHHQGNVAGIWKHISSNSTLVRSHNSEASNFSFSGSRSSQSTEELHVYLGRWPVALNGIVVPPLRSDHRDDSIFGCVQLASTSGHQARSNRIV